jgi:cytochrome P450
MAISILSPWTLAVAVVGFVVYKATAGGPRRKLPPGPKPLPLLGNINDFPPPGAVEHEHWLKLKDQYGPVSSVTVMGMTLVFLHGAKETHELLELTSNKTSGRPTNVFANKMCGYESIILCLGYNDTFRHMRKLLHRELGTKTLSNRFRHFQEAEVNHQLVRTLHRPEKALEHYKTTAAATVLQMAYGYSIEPHQDDPLVESVDQMMTEFSQAAVPMAWAVDIIPALRYLPDGFPGAGFKQTAKRWRQSFLAAANTPYQFVKRQMVEGVHRECYVSNLIDQCKIDGDVRNLAPEDNHAIMWTATSLYGAAGDTTVITLRAFTAAMIKHPHVQRKAQEEIDRVVGAGRLPGWDDREQLPYVDAVVKEILRWWVVAPMGFPHVADEDIEYDGMLIPKGAIILPSAYWLLHDPEVYADPDDFQPERFLAPRSEPDPVQFAFGFGRRICPGRFFADSSLYLNIAQSLACFSYDKAVGKDGKEIDVDIRPKPGVLSYPTDYEFKVTPRSEERVELIKRVEVERPWQPSDAGSLETWTEGKA